MITEFIFNILFGIGNTVINFFPIIDISSIGGITAIVTSLVAVSSFMPVSAFVFSIYVFVAVNSFKLASSIINWVIRKIPTID